MVAGVCGPPRPTRARCRGSKPAAPTRIGRASSQHEGTPPSSAGISVRRDAIAYRNWLMVMTLAVLPLRLRNFAALSLRHLDRRAGVWWVDIAGSETKTGRPHAALIPSDAGRFLDHYLLQIRPHLAQGTGGDRLWLSRWGSPLPEHTIYLTITELTKRAFGVSLNPHLKRLRERN
jgi:integrase